MKKSFGVLICLVFLIGFQTIYARDNKVNIAVVGANFGPLATFTNSMCRGAEQAVQVINDNGGILGRKISLLKRDDQHKPEIAIQIATDLVQREEIDFIIGHTSTHSTLAALNIYQKRNVIIINPFISAPQLTVNKNPGLFRMATRLDKLALDAVEHFKKSHSRSSVFLDMYSEESETVILESVKSKFGKSASFSSYKAADALILEPYSKDFFSHVKPENVKQKQIYIIESLSESSSFRLVLKSLLKNGRTWLVMEPNPKNMDSAREVVQNMKKKGYRPNSISVRSYAAVEIIKKAIESTHGSLSKDEELNLSGIREIMYSKEFATIAGRIRFNEYGDLSHQRSIIKKPVPQDCPESCVWDKENDKCECEGE